MQVGLNFNEYEKNIIYDGEIENQKSYPEYDFEKPIEFDAYMVPDVESNLRLLETTNEMCIPNNVQVRLLTTASDVIHS